MKKVIFAILISTVLMVSVMAQQPQFETLSAESTVHFAPLHVFIDSGRHKLAAFQFELKALAGQVKIVGVEGGEHEAFAEPAYYDPAALANDRIIIAAFDTADDLPTGRTRIATIHLQIIGDVEPEYQLDLNVAASEDGNEIPAEISFE